VALPNETHLVASSNLLVPFIGIAFGLACGLACGIAFGIIISLTAGVVFGLPGIYSLLNTIVPGAWLVQPRGNSAGA